MARTAPNRELQLSREARAWELRQESRTQAEIARELGVDQGTVSRILERVHRRELARLSARIELLKVDHTSQLEKIASSAARCFEHSKQPANRATRRTTTTADGTASAAEVTVEESAAVERDGNTAFLSAQMTALAQIRAIWGLDQGPTDAAAAGSVAEIAKELAARAKRYETRKKAAGDPPQPDPGDRGGAPPLP